WALFTGDPVFKDGKPYSDSQAGLAVLNIDYDVAPGLTLSSVTGLDYIKSQDAGIQGSIIGPTSIGGSAKYHELSEEVRLTSNWKDRWYNFIIGGLHSQQTTREHIAISFPAFLVFDGNTNGFDTETNSAFGQISLTPVDQWELDAGVRYTHVSKEYTSIYVLNNLGMPAAQTGEQLQ